MAELNGITVRFSDGIKTADYAPPRLYDITANVVLSGNDDFETVMADTMSAIQRAGYAALHGKKPVANHSQEEPASGEAPARRTRGPNKKKEDASSAETQVSAATEESAEAAKPTEPAAEDEWAAGVEDILVTDAELLAANSKRAQELSARKPIIDLILTYSTRTEGPPFKVQEIPQNQRKDYLTKLAALTA